jgi:hypothetical protein
MKSKQERVATVVEAEQSKLLTPDGPISESAAGGCRDARSGPFIHPPKLCIHGLEIGLAYFFTAFAFRGSPESHNHDFFLYYRNPYKQLYFTTPTPPENDAVEHRNTRCHNR